MADLELHRRFPGTRDLPHLPLAKLPTPVERVSSLEEKVGLRQLWVKRDDLSGARYGGNKVRKLEFLLAHAVAEGRDSVWTVGAVGSHHVLATALYCREVGLEPHALHFPQPITDHVREVLRALTTTRPTLQLVDSKHALPIHLARQHIRDWLAGAESPYYIPGGGSSPRGVLGYVNAALELARQIDNGELPAPEAIFVAAGTCGTLAGLVLGCRLAELPTRVVGVRVVDKILANPVVAAKLANDAAVLLEGYGVACPRISPLEIEIIDDQIGSGYGEPTPAGQRAMDLFDSHVDLELDPTYTAKAFAGLIDQCSANRSPLHNVLYWHTLSSADLSDLIAKAQVDQDLPALYKQFFQ